jgi:hypothetical protein
MDEGRRPGVIYYVLRYYVKRSKVRAWRIPPGATTTPPS